jgi:class 3 adenylate cyclase/tetratricopeptide (TPR) repeat protein
MGTIRQWLAGIGLEQYAQAFEREQIDADSAPYLTEANLKDLGLPMGPRARFLAAVQALSPSPRPTSVATPSGNAPEQGPATADAERRQLTVMFCDLVGSTVLAQNLDPEQLRELMRAYQQACGAVVDKYGGHVAQYLGDGLMVYFGWPRAHEDDAERAVRSALEIVASVKQVAAPSALQVRVGIATGPVVVGETGAGDASIPKVAVGETPNLAARLQGLASADEVVVAPGTHRLLGGTFDYQDLGEHALKGIVEPVHAWKVLRLAAAEGRFEAAHRTAGLTPLVGREEEIALLMRRWEQASNGEGQVALVSGEPGIGKSRTTRTLRERIGAQPHIALTYQCSPFQTQSALYPVIDQLERAAGFTREDSFDRRLDKLEALLAQGSEDPRSVAALFAQLLSLPAGRYPPLGLSPQKQKEKTLQALIAQVEGLSRRQPLLIVLEDAHWIDPTTQELFDLIVARIPELPVLVVVTFRPEYAEHWSGPHYVGELHLTRLSRRQGAQLVDKVTGGKPLPAEVLGQIVSRTDGVPLFVEELTKTILESALLRDEGNRYELAGPLQPLAIPSTLHDSLMARLDRLPQIKEVAQLGACIGREFSHELLASVSPIGEEALVAALEQLDEAELVVRRGIPPAATYTFKHALVQDAAYASLLKTTRQHHHAAIATGMTQRFAETAETRPEFVAQQFSEGGMIREAIAWWQKAGKRAFQRAAVAESVANYRKGLELAASLPASLERDQAELGLQVGLAFALMLAKGWGAPETGLAIERAAEVGRALSKAGQAGADLYWALRAPGTFYFTRGQYRVAEEIAEQCLIVAEKSGDLDVRIDSHNLRAMTAYALAKFTLAREHAELGFDLYGPGRRSHPLLLGQDTKIRLSWWHAWTLWWQGYPDQALERGREIVAYSQQSTHPFEKSWALMILGTVHILRREPAAENGAMTAAIQLAREHEFGLFKTMLPCLQADLFTLQGRPREAIAAIQEHLPAMHASGTQLTLTLILGFLANAHLALRQTVEGAAAADEGLRVAQHNAEYINVAELKRLRGELLLLRGSLSSAAEAEAAFAGALDTARDQGSKALELRAATSLARLWQQQGKRTQAHDLLAPVYGWFTEGFDTPDLTAARDVLVA